MKRIRRLKIRHPRLVYGLLMILVGIVLLDLALWKVDPIGLVRFVWSYYEWQAITISAPHGVLHLPGTHHLTGSTIIIDGSGFRAVDSPVSDCRIAFIGDSFTFGMNADTSFVNLLAPDIDEEVVNAGIIGYGIDNILQVVDTVKANGYIYLVVVNDDDPPQVWGEPRTPPPAIVLYRDYYLVGHADISNGVDYYREQAAGLIGRDDVLTFTFAGGRLSDVAAELGAVVIPDFTHRVGGYDGHPDETGHAEVAAAMRDDVMVFVSRICGGIG